MPESPERVQKYADILRTLAGPVAIKATRVEWEILMTDAADMLARYASHIREAHRAPQDPAP